MQLPKMQGMTNQVLQLPHRPPRHRRSAPRRPLRRGGRAWINGREVGGPDTRYEHLAVVHD